MSLREGLQGVLGGPEKTGDFKGKLYQDKSINVFIYLLSFIETEIPLTDYMT